MFIQRILVLLLAATVLRAEATRTIASTMQPFVDDKVLAVAVTLVANNICGFGHGGAHATNMSIDPAKGIVTVFMVQHSGWRTDDGKKILPAFQKVAAERFAKP